MVYDETVRIGTVATCLGWVLGTWGCDAPEAPEFGPYEEPAVDEPGPEEPESPGPGEPPVMEPEECRPGSVLTAQRWIDTSDPADLDALRGYEVIEGSLMLRGGAMVDLSPLACLRVVTGNLLVRDAGDLTSLGGLGRLETVGQRLEITGSPALHDLSGLRSLFRVGSLWLRDVGAVHGLPTRVEITTSERFSSEVWISGLAESESLEGLPSFSVGLHVREEDLEVRIGGNPRLTSLDGLQVDGVTRWTLVVEDNPSLQSLRGLEFLDVVGHLRIQGNAALANLEGLLGLVEIGREMVLIDNDALVSLHGPWYLRRLGTLQVASNDALRSLRGLESLEVVDSIYIGAGCYHRRPADGGVDNRSLLSLDGLEGIDTLEHLFVEDQSALANFDALGELSDLGSALLFNNPGVNADAASSFLDQYGLDAQESACGNGDAPPCSYDCPPRD